MHSFVRDLITEWRRLELPFEGATFVVAVSGGADSVSLLLALAELNKAKKLENRFVAAHFNHKLRGEESEIDEEFVKHLAESLNVELAVGHAQLPNTGNLEQNARDARYNFLKKIANSVGAQGVITAHTLNDQAETFLMNLIRGAGPDGLGGIKPIRSMFDETLGGSGVDAAGERIETDIHESGHAGAVPFLPFAPVPFLLIRPMLTWARRDDTESYCRDRGVEYRYDSMNEDLALTRVRIRKLLLPMLEDFNPKIVKTLANTASLFRDLADGSKAADTDFAAEVLDIAYLKTLEKQHLYDLLRQWLIRRRGSSRGLSMSNIKAIERLALSRKSGRLVELPNGDRVERSAGKLIFVK